MMTSTLINCFCLLLLILQMDFRYVIESYYHFLKELGDSDVVHVEIS